MFKIWSEDLKDNDRGYYERKYYIVVNECPKREIAKEEFDRIAKINERFYNTDVCKKLGPDKAAKNYMPFITIEDTYGKNYEGIKKLGDVMVEAVTNAKNNVQNALKTLADKAKNIEENSENKMLLENISIKMSDVIQKELKITSDKETEDRAIGKLIAYSNIFEMLLIKVRKENK